MSISLPTDTSQPSEIVVIGRGFDSEEQATSAGIHAKWALRVAGLSSGVAMAFGHDEATSRLGVLARERAETASGVKIVDDVHGMHVYYVDDRPAFVFRAQATGEVGKPGDTFIEALQVALRSTRLLDESMALAFDLYFLAEFETSERACVLALVTALEVLADRAPRPPAALAIVNQAINDAKSALKELDDEQSRAVFDSLIGSLRDARKESITAAMARLVAKSTSPDQRYLGRSPEDFVKDCYKTRSNLVHTGSEGDVDLGELLPELRRLVAAVLRSMADVDR
ncbi:hypothetical protein GCM10009681_54140 [Luedemannella helvata]|uniref:Apea-like HEPN domain-containing protein n=2 Tax=Luedemannella helvata TaxID=349315 RepID=A0ABP4XF00_9ACTN